MSNIGRNLPRKKTSWIRRAEQELRLLLTLDKAPWASVSSSLKGGNNTHLAYPPGLLRRLCLVMFANVPHCFKMLFKWKHLYEKRHLDHPICFLKFIFRSQNDTFEVCEINFLAITTVFQYIPLAWSMLHISFFIYFIHWDHGSAVLNNPRSCHWKLIFSLLIMKKNTNERPH